MTRGRVGGANGTFARGGRLAAVILAAALLTAASPAPARAQVGGPIAYGQTVSGEITNDTFRVVYTFQGRQGEIIEARLSRTSGNLDPVLILLDGTNTMIARDDDGGPGYAARLDSVALPSDGLYFLIAARFGQDRGLTTGGYSLSLARVGIVSDPRLEAGAIPLGFGENVVRELNDARYQHIYTFSALRGDLISLTMNRISGDLDPVLILADAQGNTLLINDDDPAFPGTLDAAITDWRVMQSGSYLVAAMRFGGAAGRTRGGYSLSLSRVPPEALGGSPERAILLDEGTVGSGVIDRDSVRRYYLVEARSGDTLSIEATRTSGNLDPTLELRAPDGRPLTAHDAGVRGRNARITAFTAPIDGLYLVIVSRFNGDEGRSTGGYTLTVARR